MLGSTDTLLSQHCEKHLHCNQHIVYMFVGISFGMMGVMNFAKHLKVKFIGEKGEDGGGPKQEFFFRMIEAMSKQHMLFDGPEESRTPKHNLMALLKDVEQAELGIQLSSGNRVGGMLFADDFVGVSDSRESLQKLIDLVHRYCNKWKLKANLSKSAVMVFSKNSVEGWWKWGEHKLPNVSSYSYLGIDFASNGSLGCTFKEST